MEERAPTTAEERARIAGEQNRRYAEAVAACGPGAQAYAVQVIKDECGLEPTRRIYCCRRPELDGWQPRTEIDPRDPGNTVPPGPWKSPTMAFGFVVAKDFNGLRAGERVRVCRYRTGFGTLELYHPLTQEQLDARAERRERKALEKEAQSSPLFADQIMSEGPTRGKKKRR